MSSNDKETAITLLGLVDEIRENAPELTLDQCIALASAGLYATLLDDAILIIGDIADALNDMRPMPGSRQVH